MIDGEKASEIPAEVKEEPKLEVTEPLPNSTEQPISDTPQKVTIPDTPENRTFSKFNPLTQFLKKSNLRLTHHFRNSRPKPLNYGSTLLMLKRQLQILSTLIRIWSNR